MDNSAAIAPNFAASTLNVNIQPGGSAIYKRDGFGLFQALSTNSSTEPVHGGYHFQQLGGSNVQVWASSNTLYGSVADAAFVALDTGTYEATWQCTDSQGYAYCFDSAGDIPIQTDGTKANTVYFSSAPLGTMATFTPLQLVVAGVSANPNTIYVSGQLAFNNFTPGILPSSPFTEPIASPGSRITHLAYYFGRLFWWKDQSFGYATFTGQNDWQLTIVSNQIGTLDNSDAFWNSSGFDSGTMFSGTSQANGNASPGGIFFRGQDNHIYVYDGYYLTRLSRIISPSVTASSSKKANSWVQTTQSDFQTGISTPTGYLSTTINPGALVVSTNGITNQFTADFASGTFNNTTLGTNSVMLSTNAAEIVDNSFETFTGDWFSPGSAWLQSSAQTGTNCNVTPINGSYMAVVSDGSISGPPPGYNITAVLVDSYTATNYGQVSWAYADGCTWTQRTISVSASALRHLVYIQFTESAGGTVMNSLPFISDGNNITFYSTGMYQFHAGVPNLYTNFTFVDYVQGTPRSTITSGSFTSYPFQVTLSSYGYAGMTASYTANTSTPTFVLQTATSTTGAWTNLSIGTGTTSAYSQPYFRYISTFTIASTDNALSTLNSATMIAESTGTYYSAVHNAPLLTTWNTFVADANLTGGNIVYYVRSSTNPFTVLSSTPTWVAQTNDALVAASTGTYFQMSATFTVTSIVQPTELDDFAFNWFEGQAQDKAYMAYFNDAIWFSVSSGTSTPKNNTIFYWDLLNGAWCLYNIPSNGFLIENNNLYFGDPNSNNIYKYGGVTSDNNAAINSYWKSPDFLYASTEYSGNGQNIAFPAVDDIFVQKQFTRADFILGESSTTLTYTYTLDSKTSTVFQITAYDSSASLIQRNFLLPVGKIGKYYNFQIGDNSTNAKWTVMGHRVHYDPLNWIPVLK